MRSAPDVPLLLIAGGTGLAPVLALLEQQVSFSPERDMVLVWGMQSISDFYAIDTLQSLAQRASHLRTTLAADNLPNLPPKLDHIEFIKGSVMDAVKGNDTLPKLCDIYVAGPPVMLREVARALESRGVRKENLHIDSFGG
jgi:NAD(P)H-flavin reductase